MRTFVVTPPTELVVALAEAKSQLRLDADDTSQDDSVTRKLQAAIDVIDGPAAWLGRALGTQVLETRAAHFPGARRGHAEAAGGFAYEDCFDTWRWRHHPHEIHLACPPIQSVTSISYIDVTGTLQVLDPSTYVTFPISDGEIERVVAPVFGTYWPQTQPVHDAVRIRYTAGYAGGIPPAVKEALLMITSSLFETRESSAAGALYGVIASGLLDKVRIYV